MRPDLPMVSCNNTSNSFSDLVLVIVNWSALNFSLLLHNMYYYQICGLPGGIS